MHVDDIFCQYLRQRHAVPAKDESPDEGSKEDADNDVAVVVHREQHDDVGNGELSHVQKRSHKLLEEIGREGLRCEEWRGGLGGRGLAGIVRSVLDASGSRRGEGGVLQMRAHDVSIVLARGSSESFERNH